MMYWLQCKNRAKNSCKDRQKNVRPEFQQIKWILNWEAKYPRPKGRASLQNDMEVQNRHSNSFQNVGVKNHPKKTAFNIKDDRDDK